MEMCRGHLEEVVLHDETGKSPDIQFRLDDTCQMLEISEYNCKCSACGKDGIYPLLSWKYCPNCGRTVKDGARWSRGEAAEPQYSGAIDLLMEEKA